MSGILAVLILAKETKRIVGLKGHVDEQIPPQKHNKLALVVQNIDTVLNK